jgi:protein SCO1/2
MNDASKKRIKPWIPVVAAIAVTAGVWFGLQNAAKREMSTMPQSSAVTVLPSGPALPEFRLIDHHGKAFGRANLENRWSLVFFGFTNCGHVCPMTMAEMRLIRDGVDESLNVVFLSVDPGRDTPQIIHEYVRSFGEDFVGITGDAEEIDKIARALGAPYFVNDSGDSYTVDHSATLFLIDPTASLAGIISQPLEIDAIVKDLGDIL